MLPREVQHWFSSISKAWDRSCAAIIDPWYGFKPSNVSSWYRHFPTGTLTKREKPLKWLFVDIIVALLRYTVSHIGELYAYMRQKLPSGVWWIRLNLSQCLFLFDVEKGCIIFSSNWRGWCCENSLCCDLQLVLSLPSANISSINPFHKTGSWSCMVGIVPAIKLKGKEIEHFRQLWSWPR